MDSRVVVVVSVGTVYWWRRSWPRYGPEMQVVEQEVEVVTSLAWKVLWDKQEVKGRATVPLVVEVPSHEVLSVKVQNVLVLDDGV